MFYQNIEIMAINGKYFRDKKTKEQKKKNKQETKLQVKFYESKLKKKEKWENYNREEKRE